MNDWLDNFQMMGIGLNEGEKSLMRFAMQKERERIIEIIESRSRATSLEALIALIKGEKIE